uniref:Uncharacterized protein n=1 Tax=Candidatus Kentrum sp. FM TaxID=2126340 RepID=A0A450S3N4_9GAMM|nr:MAG: hypothetical protein BECKFM1743C_GA0114222_100356 [Candidatus Kentron sp. FM]VFJ46253.1 MAG: hypothetical protein BECKFM1743A_GA0114220_100348 [Candidatus Kentron sp. FM]VFK10924.1 MAG: hypothetical protein BECKFM1743B_GA0114221_101603 [Candidatus Kentron sp. FM]
MLIYFHVNSAFSLPDFMTYGASLWDTIRLLHLPLAILYFCNYLILRHREFCLPSESPIFGRGG